MWEKFSFLIFLKVKFACLFVFKRFKRNCFGLNVFEFTHFSTQDKRLKQRTRIQKNRLFGFQLLSLYRQTDLSKYL